MFSLQVKKITKEFPQSFMNLTLDNIWPWGAAVVPQLQKISFPWAFLHLILCLLPQQGEMGERGEKVKR